MYQQGNYYVEADPTGPAWIWVLGDGLQGGVNCMAPIPPKQAFWGDPAASLTIGEMLPAGLVKLEQFRRDDRQAMYVKLVDVVGKRGVFSRVPAKRFSAARFAEEFTGGRVTRGVARSVAEELAGKLPLPIFFTHGRIPLFRDEEERDEARELGEWLTAKTGNLGATWARPGWGLRPEDNHGDDHYMLGVLKVIDRLDWDWAAVAECDLWQRARRFFKAVNFGEQVFGASWITQLVYVQDVDEELGRLWYRMTSLGIEVVTLEQAG